MLKGLVFHDFNISEVNFLMKIMLLSKKQYACNESQVSQFRKYIELQNLITNELNYFQEQMNKIIFKNLQIIFFLKKMHFEIEPSSRK